MKLKSEAHEAMPILFQWDWVLPAIMCDNAKEIILGEFKRKIKKHHVQDNESEREIKELKKGSVEELITLQRDFGMIS